MPSNDQVDLTGTLAEQLGVADDPRVQRAAQVFQGLGWQGMDTAPMEGRVVWVWGQLPDGTEVRMHYAHDESGEEQPPFRGWFVSVGPHSYNQVQPVRWRPFSEAESVACPACGGLLVALPTPGYTRCDACGRYARNGEVRHG